MNHYVLCFLLAGTFDIFGQDIPDNAFIWFSNEGCLAKDQCFELYLRAEKDPEFVTRTKLDFDKLLSETVSEMKLDSKVNGIIKIKLAFHTNAHICVLKTGLKGILCSKSQLYLLADNLDLFDHIKSGRHKDVEVICQGIIYLLISKGKAVECRYLNFKLKQ